jgi:uncharacterized small protein (DUF1192 family)
VFGRTQRKKRVEVNVDSEHVAEIKRLKAEIERLKAQKNAQTEELQALDNEYRNEQRHEDQEPTDIYEEQEQPLANEDQEPTDNYEHQEQPMDYEDVSQCVKLCSDNIDNVVAEGVIIEAVGYFSYHGDIITNDYARVQITQVIEGEAKISYPRGAIRYAYDACNKLVPWPRELILTEEVWNNLLVFTLMLNYI